jgi:hypothetical protein
MTGASPLVAQPDSASILEPEMTEMNFPMAPTSAAAPQHEGSERNEVDESPPSFYYPVNAHPLPLVKYRASHNGLQLVLDNVQYSGDSWPLSPASAPMTSIEYKVPPHMPPLMEGSGEVGLTSATRLTKGKKIRQKASTCQTCWCC